MRFLDIHFRSVTQRVTVLVVSVVAIIMVVGGFIEIKMMKRQVAQDMHAQASRSMDGAIKMLDNKAINVESAVNTAAAYADIYAPFENKANILLEKLINANEDIDAVTLLYRADYFPQHGRYYAPTMYREASGKLVSHIIGTPEDPYRYLETDSNWVYTNKLDDGYWCLPYMDSLSTKRPMVTYSVPLHDSKGKVYAVLCADVGLEWVQDIMETNKPYEYSLVSVLSRDAKYVYNPDSSNIMTVNALELATKENNTDQLILTERMLKWNSGSDTVDNQYLLSGQGKSQKEKTIVYYAPVKSLKWSVSFTLPESKIMERPNRLRRNMIILLVFMIIIVSIVLHKVIKGQLRVMKVLAEKAQQVAEGNFDVSLPVISTNDEIRLFRDSFEGMQHSLARYVDELKASTAHKASLENELKVANSIQMGMLPKTMPPFPDRKDIDLYARLQPAKDVGGDLYDFHIHNEKLFFCIGDVSGKGVPAALFMAMTRSLFRNLTVMLSSATEIVTSLNRALCDGNDYNMFCTMFIGILDLRDGTLEYCNAGHNAPVIIAKEGIGMSEPKVNMPLGIIADYPFKIDYTKARPGDCMFLYTDGVTEAENSRHELFGEERMMEVLASVRQRKDPTPKDYVEEMYRHVKQHANGVIQSDDITIMHLIYRGKEKVEQPYRSNMKHEASIKLPNDVQTIPQLAIFIQDICNKAGLAEQDTMTVNLAIEEAVVNVMNYAYPSDVEGEVNIKTVCDDDKLTFIITDSGKPFDPTKKEQVDISLNAEERPIGGLGIHIIRTVMDDVSYEYVDGRNVLTMTKNIQA